MTTRWSMVVAAGDQSSDALAELCRHYWQPLYRFVRRSGYQTADAQDLTQAFFERLIEKRFIEAAQPERGRFRTFLLAALKNFAQNEWKKANRLKRGGGRVQFLDFSTADKFLADDTLSDGDADAQFDRDWAMDLLSHLMQRLRQDYSDSGKIELFEALVPYLSGGSERLPYQETAAANGMNVGQVKVYVHRLRKRYRELLEHEIASTVSSPDMIEDELRYLFDVLKGR